MRIPVATYRIQFNPDFTFKDAHAIATYLKELGISDLYASPVFKARQGSTHGYDVVDPRQFNPELGGDEAFDALVQTLKAQGMGWLQDIVPNHMAYDTQNAFLMDVLENGPDSEYFSFFDIQWEHPYPDLQGKILTPLLGDFYGRCLERGELQLTYDEAGLAVNYYNNRFPLRVESYSDLITYDLGRLARSLGRQHPDFIKLLGVLYMLRHSIADTTGQQRRDQVAFVKGMLWELYQSNEEIQQFIDQNLAYFNGDANDPSSFDPLDRLLSNQFFRLSFWKVGAEELNYRRFFTVNELISVNVQKSNVFRTTHKLICEAVERGQFTGIRIDHIDGLYDPERYLDQLRSLLGDDTYIVVEKILEPEEKLPNDWPIQGTSGYDFLNTVNRLFCQPASEDALTRLYYRFTGLYDPYEEMAFEKKQLIAETNLAGDIENLANQLKRIAGRYRYASDFTLNGLRRAVMEVLVLFPIYRTYITNEGIDDRDRTYIQRVIRHAKARRPQLTKELDFIQKLLLLEHEDWLTDEERNRWTHFVMWLQQFTGPLMAKGVEDTLLYVYYRFISLNEVGGSPDAFGISLPEFHAFHTYQQQHWPYALNATSTHDTKRSEDIRARLNVLSEIPDEWDVEVETWRMLNNVHKQTGEDRLIPDANDEYFLYQTLVGALPFASYDHSTFCDRIKDYAVKAVREAKVHTAWLRPDTEYEEGFVAFIDRLLEQRDDNEFLQRLYAFSEKVSAYGIFNSLSQLLIKLTAPGVPDIYQGTEFWDLSLVDPDNRRPVDYELRSQALQTLRDRTAADMPGLLNELRSQSADGRIKLFLIMQALAARTKYVDIFQQGSYLPIKVVGDYQDHIVAFARQFENQVALTVVPRFLVKLVHPSEFPLGNAVWGNTALEIPNGDQVNWINAITNESLAGQSVLPISQILSQFPVALLISTAS